MIFPKPKHEAYFEEKYTLVNTKKADDAYSFYSQVKDGNEDITCFENKMLKKEEYGITIGKKGIIITYGTDEGLFRAITSLYQLVKKQGESLAFCEISDCPDIERRGLMINISSGRVYKLEMLKKIVDNMTELKYNELQLYMDAFCFPYEDYMEYVKEHSYITAEEVKELDRYCRERFVDLVPNQNCFGHMQAWLAKKELAHLGVGNEEYPPTTINPLMPETYEFIGKLFDSLLPCFSSKFVHVGMDEAKGLGRFQLKEYCDKYGRDTLYMEHLQKLWELAYKKHDKNIMFWADMVWDWEHMYHKIPKNAIAVEWGYQEVQVQLMYEHCRRLKEGGVKFYVASAVNAHASFTGTSDTNYFHIKTCGEIGKELGATGILLTDWGSKGGFIWSYIPLALNAQYGWNVGPKQNGEDYKCDLLHASWDFVDDYWFGGKKISKLLHRASSYYLLEAERIHNASICGRLARKPLSMSCCPSSLNNEEHQFAPYADMNYIWDEFYDNNVITYMNAVMQQFKDANLPQEQLNPILTTCKIVIFETMLNPIRVSQSVSAEKLKEIEALIDEIKADYVSLWNNELKEKGMEIYFNYLENRRNELRALCTDK